MVRELLLNHGFCALVDDEDYERCAAIRWIACKHNQTHYAKARGHNGRTIYLHRFVLNARTGTEIDHRNGDGLDCQRRNLREATRSQQAANCRSRIGESGYRGVTKHHRPGKWCARVTVSGREIRQFGFTDPRVAALAYDELARQHFGEFAIVNFPRKNERGVA